MKFFRLTRNERIGLVGFVFIFIGILAVKCFDSDPVIKYYPASTYFNGASFNRDTLCEINRVIKNKKKVNFLKQKEVLISPFERFNPNNVDQEYWLKLGFSMKLAIRINKFIKKGLGVEGVKDLEVIYGMKPEWINAIRDSIIIPRKVIFLNTATRKEFQKINGIGEVISGRIIKFRDLLGGFYSSSQLYQVYGIDSLVVLKNIGLFKIQKPCEKINIQSSGLNMLTSHFYINKDQAKSVIKLRSVFGELDSSRLQNIFSANEWLKIKNYLEWKN